MPKLVEFAGLKGLTSSLSWLLGFLLAEGCDTQRCQRDLGCLSFLRRTDSQPQRKDLEGEEFVFEKWEELTRPGLIPASMFKRDER